MEKIVFLDAATLGGTSLQPIAELGELVCFPTSTPEEATERVKDADILIVNKIKVTDSLLSAAPKLKLLCEAATGVNNIDLEAARKRGIPVRNVAGYSTDSVAQLTFTQVLTLLCRPARFDSYVKDGSYSASGIFTEVSSPFTEIAGKTMGVIGMGTIGGKVAAIASAFGMKVIYFSTSGTSHCKDYPSVSLAELLEKSDVVSIHAPLNDATRGLIGADQLRTMKPSAILVNMARGGIVDEKALADALDAGTIAGAALDVFTTEPIPSANPLMAMSHPERILFTPHVAWASSEALNRLVLGIAANIRNYQQNVSR